MKGLIIKAPWIDMILDGKKTWEIRSSNTKIRGKIALIESGTGKIKGYATLVYSFPMNHTHFLAYPDRHGISQKSFRDNGFPYKTPHAWVLDKPKRLKKPKSYKHPNGAVIWVNL